MTEQEKIDRGQQAAALLAHPLMTEAFEGLREYWWLQFCNTAPTDTNNLVQCRLMLEAADNFERLLRGVVNDGKSAAAKAEHVPKEIE